MSEPTARQAAVLAHIGAFRAEHGYSPTVRDVARHFGININAINGFLKALIRKGRLARVPGVARGLVPAGAPAVRLVAPGPRGVLTARQAAVLAFIASSAAERGVPPAYREIQARFGFRGPTGCVHHIEALTRKGYLRRTPTIARGIALVGPAPGEGSP